jgi:O-antigen/teichoic acid export membrane protein
MKAWFGLKDFLGGALGERWSFEAAIVVTFLAYAVAFGVEAVSNIVIANGLGPSGLGRFAYLVNVGTLVALAVGLGLPAAASFFSAQDSGWVNRIYGVALMHLIVLCSFFAAAFTVGHWGFPAAGLRIQSEAGYFLLLIVALVSYEYVNRLLQGHMYYLRYGFISLARVIALFVFLLGFRERLNVPVAVAGTAGAYLFAGTLGFFLLDRWCRPVVSIGAAKLLISYGARFIVANFMGQLILKASFYILAKLSNMTEVGYYSVAEHLLLPMSFGSSVIGAILFPKVAAQEREMDGRIYLSAKILLLLNLIYVGVIMLLGPELLGLLYHPDFSKSYLPAVLLAAGGSVYFATAPFAYSMAARGYPKGLFGAQFVGLLGIGMASLVAGRSMNASVAAVCAMVGWTVAAIGLVGYYRRRYPVVPGAVA